MQAAAEAQAARELAQGRSQSGLPARAGGGGGACGGACGGAGVPRAWSCEEPEPKLRRQVTQGFSDSRDLLAEAKAEKAKVRANPNPSPNHLTLTLGLALALLADPSPSPNNPNSNPDSLNPEA